MWHMNVEASVDIHTTTGHKFNDFTGGGPATATHEMK